MDKDTKDFLKQFSEQSSTPNPKFLKNLENKIQKEYVGKSFIVSLLQYASPIFLILIIFVFVQSGFNIQNEIQTTRSYAVSEEREREIFSQLQSSNILPILEKSIAQNNSGIITDALVSNFKQENMDTEIKLMPDSYPISYFEPVQMVVEKISRGPQFNSCDLITQRYKNIDEIRTMYFESDGEVVKKVEEIESTDENILGIESPVSFPISFSQANFEVYQEAITQDDRFFILKIEKEEEECSSNFIFLTSIRESDLKITSIEGYKDQVSEENKVYKVEIF